MTAVVGSGSGVAAAAEWGLMSAAPAGVSARAVRVVYNFADNYDVVRRCRLTL